MVLASGSYGMLFSVKNFKWDKVFKNGPSKIF